MIQIQGQEWVHSPIGPISRAGPKNGFTRGDLRRFQQVPFTLTPPIHRLSAIRGPQSGFPQQRNAGRAGLSCVSLDPSCPLPGQAGIRGSWEPFSGGHGAPVHYRRGSSNEYASAQGGKSKAKKSHPNGWLFHNPAYTGNTHDIEFILSVAAVHPRVRGEHTCALTGIPDTVGSSPRARGTLMADNTCHVHRRIIPKWGTRLPGSRYRHCSRFIPANTGNTHG